MNETQKYNTASCLLYQCAVIVITHLQHTEPVNLNAGLEHIRLWFLSA